MTGKINPLHFVFIAIAGCILFLPGLGDVHLFDWDEINFAESAREMIVTGDYSRVQINYQPFWEKPPLFIWLQALSMHCFGVNEFAARFPNVIFGILTLCVIYYWGRKVFKGHLAHWWVLCYLGSITPHFYFKTGLIDPGFNFFIFLGILQFYLALKNHSVDYNPNRHFLLAGLFTGIAILCKGPAALLISLIVLFAMVVAKRITWFFHAGNLMIYFLALTIVSSLWFIPETVRNGPYFILEFIRYQAGLFSQNVAGHEQPFYYHTLVLLIGCFPVSIVAIATWKKNEYYTYHENLFRITMLCLFWTVLILFSVVRTKIVHYSSLCWLPLTFMGAYGIESINQAVFRWRGLFKFLLLVTGFLWAIIWISFPLIMLYAKEEFLIRIPDTFTKANLSVDAGWSLMDVVPGSVLLLLMIVLAFRKPEAWKVQTFGLLFIVNCLTIMIISLMFTGKIEKHFQGSAIRFFKEHRDEHCYIFHAGYKSYAPYFYARTKPLRYMDGLNLLNESYFKSKGKTDYLQLSDMEKNELDDLQKEWLLHGNTDRTVYFIAKINNKEGLDQENGLEEISNEGGFVTYRRKAVQTHSSD